MRFFQIPNKNVEVTLLLKMFKEAKVEVCLTSRPNPSNLELEHYFQSEANDAPDLESVVKRGVRIRRILFLPKGPNILSAKFLDFNKHLGVELRASVAQMPTFLSFVCVDRRKVFVACSMSNAQFALEIYGNESEYATIFVDYFDHLWKEARSIKHFSSARRKPHD